MQSSGNELEQQLLDNLLAAEQQWGSDHTRTISSLQSLAHFYASQKHDDEAESLWLRALRIWTASIDVKLASPTDEAGMLAIEPTEKAEVLHELGALYARQHRLKEAEEMLKQALTIRGRWVETGHSEAVSPEWREIRKGQAAATLSMLATVYQRRGEYTQAEELTLSALRKYEQSYGSDHIMLRGVLHQLEMLCRLQGRYADADAWKQRHEDRLWQAGPSRMEEIHADLQAKLGVSRRQVAALREGRFQEAEAFYRQRLERQEIIEGQDQDQGEDIAGQDEDKEALPGMESLSLVNILSIQEKHEEAEDLCRRIVRGCEQQYGSESDLLVPALINLARICGAQQKYGESERTYRRALHISRRVHGNEHPNTTSTQALLAGCLVDIGKYEEAEMLSKKALAISEKQGIVEQESTGLPQSNLARLYEKQERYEEAEAFYRRLLDIQERKYGPEHFIVAGTLCSLARVCWRLINYREAKKLYEHALSIYAVQQEQWQRFPSMVRHIQEVKQEYENFLHDI